MKIVYCGERSSGKIHTEITDACNSTANQAGQSYNTLAQDFIALCSLKFVWSIRCFSYAPHKMTATCIYHIFHIFSYGSEILSSQY